MSRFYPNRLVASLAIIALTVTAGLTPGVAMASEAQVKSTYNIQSTQSLINTLTRLGGYDRYGTAVQIADHGWQSASTVVLAPSGDLNMVDALASSSLATAVDGPILLADKDSVPSSTMTELKKLGVTKVYLVSGTAVISAKVESDLSAVGIVSSPSNVHVVAETRTTLGSILVQSTVTVESQSGANVGPLIAQPQREVPINVQLQGTFSNDVSLSGSVKLTAAAGAVVPTVKVTEATTPASIQLAGQFPSVTIDDNSSITVLSGKVDKLEAKGTSEIVVKSGAEVTVLSSDAGDIKVSGGGTVNGKTTTDTPTELGDILSTPVVTSDGSGTSGGRDRSNNTTVADNATIAAAKAVLEAAATLNPVDGTDTNVAAMVQALVDATPEAVGVTVTVSDASGNASIADDGTITYNGNTGDVVFALNMGTGTEATATMSVVVPHSKAECDAAIVAAKAVLEAAATLSPVEGTDTNVAAMAQALVDAPEAVGVIVTVSDASSNASIADDGMITYNGNTGDVVFALNMGTGTEATATMSVVVSAE